MKRVALLVCLGMVVVSGLAACSDDSSDEAETVVIEVPLGTAERQEAGEEIELMPSNLEMKVGDTLRVVNNDEAIQTVGPYTVAPGQTLRQTFTEPGEIVGLCSLSATGEVTITIT